MMLFAATIGMLQVFLERSEGPQSGRNAVDSAPYPPRRSCIASAKEASPSIVHAAAASARPDRLDPFASFPARELDTLRPSAPSKMERMDTSASPSSRSRIRLEHSCLTQVN